MSSPDTYFDPDLEATLREELRRGIVPPATPEHVRDRVERIAADAMSARRGRLARLAGRPWVGAARAVVAVVAVAAVATTALLWQRSPKLPESASPTAGVVVSSPGMVVIVGVTPDGGGVVYVDGEGLRVTTDHGATWSEPRQIPASDSIQDHVWDSGTLDFVDSQHGWMTGVTNNPDGSQVVEYRTTDGGRTWHSSPVTSLPPDTSTPGSFVGAQQHFWDALHGRLILERMVPGAGEGACQAWETSDAGRTWSGPRSASCIGLIPDAAWVTATVGYASPMSTDSATVPVTEDGGRTWHSGLLPGTWGLAVPQILVQDGAGGLTLVVAGGLYSEAQPVRVLHSSDGGDSWSTDHALTLPDGAVSVGELSALTPDHWIALADYTGAAPCPSNASPCTISEAYQLAETGDGGRTWRSVGGEKLYGAGSLRWWDDRRGLVLADSQDCAERNGVNCESNKTVYVTDDGGQTWHAAF